MRTISIQADGGPGGNDDVMRGALRYVVTTMPVSDKGFKFDGDLHDGTIVNHRVHGEWVVSFRPIGDDPSAPPHLYQPRRSGAGDHRAPAQHRLNEEPMHIPAIHADQRRDCCQCCCQATRQGAPHADSCGMSVQHADCNGRFWMMCPRGTPPSTWPTHYGRVPLRCPELPSIANDHH